MVASHVPFTPVPDTVFMVTAKQGTGDLTSLVRGAKHAVIQYGTADGDVAQPDTARLYLAAGETLDVHDSPALVYGGNARFCVELMDPDAKTLEQARLIADRRLQDGNLLAATQGGDNEVQQHYDIDSPLPAASASTSKR
jgi:hypothetical protein